jgi:hypothetical protein
MPRSLALVVVMPFLIATLRANPHLDDDGFIRTWIVFAPVPLVAGTSAADAIDQPHLRNEAELAPRSGDQVAIGGKQRKWKSGTFKNFIVDFNAFIGAQTHNAVGYAVTYIYCDDEVSDLALSIGFNDFGKAYLNGREALKQTEGGALQKDRVTVPVTLKKGRNILILKTINEANNFEACARLVQTDGTPLRDITITTDP